MNPISGYVHWWNTMDRVGVGNSPLPKIALRSIFERYCEPHRHYHTWSHIVYMLDMLAQFRTRLGDLDFDALRLAIYFHDVIYQTTPNANSEEHSAVYAQEVLTQLEIQPPDLPAKVADLVRSTKDHRGDSLEAIILNDLDLAILAAPSWTYKEYAEGIRREYSAYSNEQYNVGRLAVLTNFLQRQKIYASDFFYENFELAARANIEHEIQELKEK